MIEYKTPNFKPLANRILVQYLKVEEKLPSGIILPDSCNKKQEKAKVICIGDGNKDSEGNFIKIPVKTGDIILIEKYRGIDINFENEEYLLIRSEDIIAIVEE